MLCLGEKYLLDNGGRSGICCAICHEGDANLSRIMRCSNAQRLGAHGLIRIGEDGTTLEELADVVSIKSFPVTR